ncbi:hypothetical protein C2E23DRAFT_851730 [Lenzites betulinus]|nr:hypothetical protein C2E23DRAFT_851730 [Lenzites betulinus]
MADCAILLWASISLRETGVSSATRTSHENTVPATIVNGPSARSPVSKLDTCNVTGDAHSCHSNKETPHCCGGTGVLMVQPAWARVPVNNVVARIDARRS